MIILRFILGQAASKTDSNSIDILGKMVYNDSVILSGRKHNKTDCIASEKACDTLFSSAFLPVLHDSPDCAAVVAPVFGGNCTDTLSPLTDTLPTLTDTLLPLTDIAGLTDLTDTAAAESLSAGGKINRLTRGGYIFMHSGYIVRLVNRLVGGKLLLGCKPLFCEFFKNGKRAISAFDSSIFDSERSECDRAEKERGDKKKSGTNCSEPDFSAALSSTLPDYSVGLIAFLFALLAFLMLFFAFSAAKPLFIQNLICAFSAAFLAVIALFFALARPKSWQSVRLD